MSYLVIARKWRPQTFDEVIGQEHVTVTLTNAIKNQRLASGYIFSGPRGVGKTTTARIFAKALNCESGPSPTPCNTCSACEEIAAGHALDVLEIDGASNRGIDEVRSLRESTRYTPSRSRYKIYIIDEVHMLTTEAFNALLKTLEEPPPHVLFIFATTEVNKIPPTILSRCQRFDFRRIPLAQITEQLERICRAENIEFEPNALNLIAKSADGCMRDGQSLLDQVVSFCGEKLHEADVIQMLGIIDEDLLFATSKAILDRDTARLIDIVHEIHQNGYDPIDFVQSFAEHLHQVLLVRTSGDRAGAGPHVEKYQQEASARSELDLIRMLKLVNEAVTTLRRATNPQLQLEILLLQLANMATSIELQELFAAFDEVKKKAPALEKPESHVRIIPELSQQRLSKSLFDTLRGKSKPEYGAASPTAGEGRTVADRPQPDIVLEDVQEKWPSIVDAVKKEKITLGAFLEEGTVCGLNRNRVRIAFSAANGFHIATLNDHRVLLQRIFSEQLGVNIVLEFTRETQAAQSTPAALVEPKAPVAALRPDSEAPARAPEAAVANVEPGPPDGDQPLVQRLLEVLGGELISEP